jgi:hypothetical protein
MKSSTHSSHGSLVVASDETLHNGILQLALNAKCEPHLVPVLTAAKKS